MAMVFCTSKDCVLQQYHHHHLHDRHSSSYERVPQLKLPFREAQQDGYKYKLILRRPILEPLCQLALRAKDFNHSTCSYEKASSARLLRSYNCSSHNVASRTAFVHKIAEAFEDTCEQRQRQVNTRISASLDADEGKADGARKALEQMFQGKNNLNKKWEEEIKKREVSGSDGSGGGGGGRSGGWGGGGGAGDDSMDEDFGGQDEPWDWEEAGQTFMATFALIILYFSITHGPKQVFRLFALFFRYVRQGFRLRKIPEEYLQGPEDEDDTDDEDEEGRSDEASDDERLPARKADVSVSDAQERNVQDNQDEGEESEDDTNGLPPPPPGYKKESRMAILQAQHKEKLFNMLAPKELQEEDK